MILNTKGGNNMLNMIKRKLGLVKNKNKLEELKEYFKKEYGVNVDIKVYIHAISNNFTKKGANQLAKELEKKEKIAIRKVDESGCFLGSLFEDIEINIFK